jgi:hypothetical protein
MQRSVAGRDLFDPLSPLPRIVRERLPGFSTVKTSSAIWLDCVLKV